MEIHARDIRSIPKFPVNKTMKTERRPSLSTHIFFCELFFRARERESRARETAKRAKNIKHPSVLLIGTLSMYADGDGKNDA